ncbi:alcohol dehydrogenase catalytic domain-containing protein [Pseudonocardia humida]|uniref:alcohol dehydrogenase catalytic domain-containing protein n=1 Tax=Pseudonocardia humida TaxID=2800819 RepID=UPI00207CB5CD|nr:alcohol dehydrogenase catalytic domain-containing protein [Pseudonocardia humida]
MRTRAVICREAGAPWELVELDLDEPGAREVRVRFRAAGLCHLDEHARTGGLPVRAPFVGGHEGAGVVEAVGPGVSRVAVGDHVLCSPVPVCGRCRYCATGRQNLCEDGAGPANGAPPFRLGDAEVGGFRGLGTFSERAVVAEASCIGVPAELSPEVAALLGCTVPTGWGSAVRLAGVRAGQTVVVFGCGGVGTSAVRAAATAGARRVVVVDPVPLKRETALRSGATHAFADAAAAHDFVVADTWGELADHAIVTVGRVDDAVLDAALLVVGKAGQVTVTSLGPGSFRHHPSPAIAYTRRIRGGPHGGCNPLDDIPRLVRMHQDGQLDVGGLLTDRYRLDDVRTGFDDLLAGRGVRGVIIHGR